MLTVIGDVAVDLVLLQDADQGVLAEEVVLHDQDLHIATAVV